MIDLNKLLDMFFFFDKLLDLLTTIEKLAT